LQGFDCDWRRKLKSVLESFHETREPRTRTRDKESMKHEDEEPELKNLMTN